MSERNDRSRSSKEGWDGTPDVNEEVLCDWCDKVAGYSEEDVTWHEVRTTMWGATASDTVCSECFAEWKNRWEETNTILTEPWRVGGPY